MSLTFDVVNFATTGHQTGKEKKMLVSASLKDRFLGSILKITGIFGDKGQRQGEEEVCDLVCMVF